MSLEKYTRQSSAPPSYLRAFILGSGDVCTFGFTSNDTYKRQAVRVEICIQILSRVDDLILSLLTLNNLILSVYPVISPHSIGRLNSPF